MRAATLQRPFPVRLRVPHTSPVLLLACYDVFAMTETNTVWYGKTQQGSYLCQQNRNRWDLRMRREQSQVQYASEVVDFQYYARIAEERQDIQVQRVCYWKNIRQKDRDGAPEAQHHFDRQLHRENVSQHLKPHNSNKTFRIFPTRFVAIIHEETGIRQHLTLTSVPHDIYKNPLNFFCLWGTKPLSVLQTNLN